MAHFPFPPLPSTLPFARLIDLLANEPHLWPQWEHAATQWCQDQPEALPLVVAHTIEDIHAALLFSDLLRARTEQWLLLKRNTCGR